MDNVVRIGTRASQLAMIQAREVQSMLTTAFPQLDVEIVAMTTKGDKILDVALSKIGDKALFTKELETALLKSACDLVVHSLKDLPTALPSGLELAAVLPRHDPRDCVCFNKRVPPSVRTLEDLPAGSVIGTSSLRRRAQLMRAYPHLEFQDVRGNLNTRFAKLYDPNGPYTALVLAAAGVERMGWSERIKLVLDPSTFRYAVGQGALGIEIRAGDQRIAQMFQRLACHETTLRCLAEREYLRVLEGGCQVPIGVHSRVVAAPQPEGSFRLHLAGIVLSLDGKLVAEDQVADQPVSSPADAEAVGRDLAAAVLRKGAGDILKGIDRGSAALTAPTTIQSQL